MWKGFPGFLRRNAQILVAVAIIVVGVCIMLAPWFRAWRFSYLQRRMMGAWQRGVSGEVVPDGGGGWSTAVAAISSAGPLDDIWEEDVDPGFDIAHLAGIIDGVLTIDRIRLEVPIIGIYTQEYLNISICAVVESRAMGQPGNYVLSGHRSRIYGRHFNRLAELAPGDAIVVENREERFLYEVERVFFVAPSEVWVMEDDCDRRLITLITCDYRTDPAGRLIVRGELVEGLG